MKVKFSFKEDGEFFELEEGLCSCESSPLPHDPRPISEITIDTPYDGPPWEPDFIFVQIESGPKHSSDFSVPACKKCHKLMVSQERLESHRNEEPGRITFNPRGFPKMEAS
ncbi:hypothetical protein LCGC14_3057970 [marine sediment metagenome]|uniref:Uncharacterized protein n=1 Tax=marine sediment metagenome TaxID=412755 RepID=A0A0F8WJN2_9ZZZZ